MKIKVEKLTSLDLLREANEFTMGHRCSSKQTLGAAYATRHSPKRTQLFVVRMYGIPSFVSTHLVRHAAVGQQHYVQSNRPDLGGDKKADRYTPINHMMVLNAQHLQEMAWERLCYRASKETREVMELIRMQVAVSGDTELADVMVPYCEKFGICDEPKCCGHVNKLVRLM